MLNLVFIIKVITKEFVFKQLVLITFIIIIKEFIFEQQELIAIKFIIKEFILK